MRKWTAFTRILPFADPAERAARITPESPAINKLLNSGFDNAISAAQMKFRGASIEQLKQTWKQISEIGTIQMSLQNYPYPVPAGNMQLLLLPGLNPEDVTLDTQGRILCGLEDGSIVRMEAEGSDACVVVNTGGRPLGLDWLPDGRLLVGDCVRGLLAIDLSSQAIDVLVDAENGRRLMICNNAAVAKDGTIYFSDSSRRYPLSEIQTDIIEHIATGRLLRRNVDGSLDVLLENLQFANGVVLAPDESFVLVAETGGGKINRVWLTG